MTTAVTTIPGSQPAASSPAPPSVPAPTIPVSRRLTADQLPSHLSSRSASSVSLHDETLWQSVAAMLQPALGPLTAPSAPTTMASAGVQTQPPAATASAVSVESSEVKHADSMQLTSAKDASTQAAAAISNTAALALPAMSEQQAASSATAVSELAEQAINQTQGLGGPSLSTQVCDLAIAAHRFESQ